MRPYLDTGFLLTLLTRAHAQVEAMQTIQHFEAPFELNNLHRLQLDLFFSNELDKEGTRIKLTAAQARGEWERYWEESVFIENQPDWPEALRRSRIWVQHSKTPLSAFALLLLHPIIAKGEGFTHFLSFDPRSRAVAESLGLKVLPKLSN